MPAAYIVAVLVFAVAWLAGRPVVAGGITGLLRGKFVGWEKLQPQVYLDAARNDSRRYTWREPSPTVKQDFRKLSANVSRDVCIVALAAGSPPHEHDPVSIKVTGGRITPATIVVSPGSRLSFKNFDPFPHVLYEVGNDKWAPNAVGPGSTREWGAIAPGEHVIRDELFPSVVMYVVVDAAAVEFALPDHEGSFGMALPPGDYTVKAFFDGKSVAREAVVHIGGGVVDMREPMAAVGSGDSK